LASQQSEPNNSFYSNGYCETLLVANGKVINFINDPGSLGIEETKMRISQWLT
jgi:hypothetical protein